MTFKRIARLGTALRERLNLGTAIAAAAVWLGLVVAATLFFMDIERGPGPDRAVDSDWPAKSRLAPADDRPTLVLVAHPRCPCTGASLEHLASIITRSTRGFRGYVLFLRPSGVDAGWTRTAAWTRATELPGFTPVEDPDGAEARLFGATTSGHVFLYGPDGRLRFSGGITAGRGVEGRNSGMDAILEVLENQAPTYPRTPVFGCPLADSDGGPKP